ncbi:alpha/beta hydrolase [Niabella insulamsoli]|uniref:alpha/beta hydrolase n=1 Tax=Niabella insulamsoli TaxID=3144874 RepID=UPI0031FC6C42
MGLKKTVGSDQDPTVWFQKIMKIVTLLLFLSLQLFARAQEKIVTGEQHCLYSSVLKEERRIRVALPRNYSNSKITPASYPVLYVLDGEMAFEYYTAIVNFLSKGVYASMPEMIVVGIDNTDRTRDMTPTRASKRAPDDSTKILFQNSGGAENFSTFIGQELTRFIDSAYRTSGFKLLAGHSFGGLFSTYHLLRGQPAFHAYLIHAPSLWWDHQVMLSQARQTLPKANFGRARVYVSQANNKEKGVFDAHFESIKMFKNICDSINNPSLAIRYEFYENEDHGTLPLPAAYNGLKFIFDGYQVDFKKIANNYASLSESYSAFSKKTNFHFQPSEYMLHFIVEYFKDNGKPAAAAAVLKQYQQLYPKTAPPTL